MYVMWSYPDAPDAPCLWATGSENAEITQIAGSQEQRQEHLRALRESSRLINGFGRLNDLKRLSAGLW